MSTIVLTIFIFIALIAGCGIGYLIFRYVITGRYKQMINDANKEANVIKEIANTENCVIVGRSADYILRDNKNLIKIFLYAPEQYKIETIKRLYNDNDSTAKSYIKKSDKARSTYYEVISNQIWGNKNNYDICLDCQIGNDEIVKIICNYVKNKMKNSKKSY